jgi:hypothetical protein
VRRLPASRLRSVGSITPVALESLVLSPHSCQLIFPYLICSCFKVSSCHDTPFSCRVAAFCPLALLTYPFLSFFFFIFHLLHHTIVFLLSTLEGNLLSAQFHCEGRQTARERIGRPLFDFPPYLIFFPTHRAQQLRRKTS